MGHALFGKNVSDSGQRFAVTKWVVAAVVSIGLHGFFVTQWPSPFLKKPIWNSLQDRDQSLMVTFDPLEEEPAKDSAAIPVKGIDSQALSDLKRARIPKAKPEGERKSLHSAAGLAGAGKRPENRIPEPEKRLTSVPAHASSGQPEQLTSTRVSSASAKSSEQPKKQPIPPQISSVQPEKQPESSAVPSMTPADFARYRYKQILRHRLERAIGYPAGQQPGRVALSLTVRRDGQIQQAACEEGRSSLLGKAAVEGVARAQPFPRFPEDLPSDRETYEFLIAFEPAGNSSVSP